MQQIKRNPAPLDGDRVSKTDFVCAEIFRDDTQIHSPSQLITDAVDPQEMPIIAAHFFGLSIVVVGGA